MKIDFRRSTVAIAALVCFGCSSLLAQGKTDGKLKVYFIDVDGGQATLFITPAGQSLLIDTGWPGQNGLDADRIVSIAKKEGLSKIDYVLITHYHADHAGGIPELVKRIPVGTFLDHGPNREFDKGITEKDYAEYQKVLAAGKSKVIHETPGQLLPIKGMQATVISSDGKLIEKPLAGGGETNSYCASSEIRPEDQTENAHSLGIAINFGKVKLLDLGDLTWDKERVLMCPTNKLGPIDVLIVSHHGWIQSSSPALVYAIHPQVAIMDNGAMKGGSTPILKIFKASPGLEALWQLHYSNEGGDANNTAEELIANPKGPDSAHYIELIANKNGSYDVINERTGLTKHYTAK